VAQTVGPADAAKSYGLVKAAYGVQAQKEEAEEHCC